YNYANPVLPDYFQIDSIREMDNTPADNQITDWGASLGRVLFYDVDLSANRTVSCASCHQAEHGFSDPSRLSEGFEGLKTSRNSMGLANARYYTNGAFFWDERAASLEEQVLMPIQDHIEMGLTLDEMVARLNATDYYPYLFEKAFGEPEITQTKAAKALAQFTRAMVSYQSPYDIGRAQVDDHMQPFPNFTEMENEGKDVFFNTLRANCGSCHLPDIFSGKEAFNIGLQMEYEDNGMGVVSGDPSQNGVFKVPSLKNIALTAPFMHDGRFDSLEQVVDFYNEEVVEHPNLGDPLRFWLPGGPPRPLFLSESEKEALVAFMKTLTDSVMIQDPKWSDPFLP
ncbi:MAG: cytochrome c peroxidase, partial [Bacteroidota bacterium]